MRSFKSLAFQLFIVFCPVLSQTAFSQAPIPGPIQGPAVFCSPMSGGIQYSVTASNSPTGFAWSYVGTSNNLILSNASTSLVTVSLLTTYATATYTLYCTVSNGSGSSTASFVVNVFETPTVTFSGSHSFCQGSSTNISASATLFQASSTTLSYSWSPASSLTSTNTANTTAFPPTSLNYTLLVANGACTSVNYFSVTVNPLPAVSASSTRSIICKGESETLFLNGTAISYSLNGVSSATAAQVNPTASAVYTISGKDANGCKNSFIYPMTVNLCLRLEEFKNASVLQIFPNPSRNYFTVRSNRSGPAYIVNELGEIVRSFSVAADEDFQVSDLKPGIYFMIAGDLRKKVVITP